MNADECMIQLKVRVYWIFRANRIQMQLAKTHIKNLIIIKPKIKY